jgi:hypothetical protein
MSLTDVIAELRRFRARRWLMLLSDGILVYRREPKAVRNLSSETKK